MLRVGIVGAGSMGATHAAAWAKTPATLVGFYALDSQRATGLAHDYNAKKYDSYEALIDEVDVIDICTPTHLHHAQVLQAAKAGKHIICEKPIALNIVHAQEMIATCAAHGVHFLIAHVVRFFPEYALAKAAVLRGDIGEPAVLRLTRCSYQPNRTQSATSNWFLDTLRSGGMMVDLMIHDFDYARWVAGDVVSVYAKNARSRNPNAAGDYGIAILTHKNGAISNIEGGWCYPPPTFRTALEIAGSHGVIEHPVGSSTPINFYMMQNEAGEVPSVGLPQSPLAEDPYTSEIKHFYQVIVNGVTPRVTALDGLRALEISLAAIKSAETGKPVEILA